MKIQKLHLLLMPVGDLTDVIITPISYAQDLAFMKEATSKKTKKPDVEKLSALRVEAMTGLNEAAMDELARPDINTIMDWVTVFLMSDSNTVAELLKLTVEPEGETTAWTVGDEPMSANLLVILDDGTDKFSLKYPTGKVTKQFEALTDDNHRSEFLATACTSLSALQVKALSTPDWTHLQNKLTDFLKQKADFFRS